MMHVGYEINCRTHKLFDKEEVRGNIKPAQHEAVGTSRVVERRDLFFFFVSFLFKG